MTDARLRSLWQRVGPLAAVATLSLAGAAAQGCGGSSSGDTGSSTGKTTHSTTSTSTGGEGGGGNGGGGGSATGSTATTGTGTSTSTTATGTGGGGGGGGTGGSAPLAQSKVADSSIALDAVPTPDGVTIYWLGVDATTNLATVYANPADGSVATPGDNKNTGLEAPRGISISSDGHTLYIADPGYTDASSKKDFGAIVSGAATGNAAVAAVSGTVGTSPRGLDVFKDTSSDTIFFTGSDKANGAVGVFTVPAAGGTISTVFSGAPLIDPQGVAVSADGKTVYVVDSSSADGLGVVYVVNAGAATALVSDLHVGYPGGIALSLDQKTLWVSGLDKDKGTNALLEIDISSKTVTPVASSVAKAIDAAGLHRALTKDVFAWADSAVAGQLSVIK